MQNVIPLSTFFRLLGRNGDIPLSRRLKAWWDGYDIARRQADSQSEKSGGAESPEPKADPPDAEKWADHWLPPNIRIAERLWGAGFISPGGEEHILHLVKPFAMGPEHTVLDLHAGLGGGPRAMVDAFSVWVTGMEPSPELAEAGMEQSTMAGLAKKAPVSVYDPESVELRKKRYDCVFMKELLFRVVRKEHFLSTVAGSLKTNGQFLFTDYLLPSRDKMDEDVEAWVRSELIPPELWTIDEVSELLKKCSLDIRTCEDMTDIQINHVLAGWQSLVQDLRPRHVDGKDAEALIREGETWSRRLTLMREGKLRLYRFHTLSLKR